MAHSRRGLPHSPAEARGQAAVGLLGAALIILLGVAAFGALGHALLGRGRLQRAADLAAISAARAMREDFPRLFEPARDPRGRPNPRHLERREYLARASVAAAEVARANGARGAAPRVSFPDGSSFAPLRVRVRLAGTVSGREGGRGGAVRTSASAEAELMPPANIARADPWSGGYPGPFAYRQGKPMRPDVALAFDRELRAALAESVWHTGCTSWYVDENGNDPNQWPCLWSTYRRRTARIDPGAYELTTPAPDRELTA